MAMTSMSVRVDGDIKARAQELFTALGMDMSTAINVFLRQAIQRQGLPFEVIRHTPNKETLEAMAEVEEMMKHPELYPGYKNAREMVRDILA